MSQTGKNLKLSPRLRLGIGQGYSQNQILKFSAIICLVLALGLTLNAFRLILINKTDSSASPQVLGVSDTREPAGQAGVQFTAYAVQKGDTLFNISQKFNIDWTTLATLNNLKSPFVLKQGQTINIPK